ncbi:MAG: type VI secretion system baseplate subunit TssK [Bryobacteraceae bacterium]
MKRLEPVIWTKGTFLSPQHLQMQDRFLESVLQFQIGALSFRPWGFHNLQIDQEGLSGGLFALSSASGIFPDGLLFDIANADPAPEPKILAEVFEPEQRSLDLYLAIPDYRDRGLNVAGGKRDLNTRYRAEFELFRDENTGAGEKPVQVARKNFRLLAEGETQDGFSTLRVGRVLKTEAGAFQLDPRFVPPLINLRASEYLVSIARRIVEILSSRSSTLSGMRRQKNQTLADFTASDIANFWLLYTINTSFPAMRHLFETRGGHPEALYNAMLALAGALTTFSLNIHPRDLPAYDHDDLGGCFTELDEKLRLLLDTVVPSNVVSIPLKLVQPSIYAASLDQDKYLHGTKMYLAIHAECSQAEVINKAPLLIKVCSATHIEHLVKQALPGMPLTHVISPPSAIPIKLNCQYFSLTQTGLAWEAVVRARNLAAYVPGDFPNPQLELVILLPQAA